MTDRYAARTEVTADRSRAEIERTLTRYQRSAAAAIARSERVKPDDRQGVYLAVTRSGRLYIGSVAGKGRSFARRWAEHIKDLEHGTHANDGLSKDGPEGLRFIPIAVVRRGDIAQARKIESVIIKALRKVVCNERG